MVWRRPVPAWRKAFPRRPYPSPFPVARPPIRPKGRGFGRVPDRARHRGTHRLRLGMKRPASPSHAMQASRPPEPRRAGPTNLADPPKPPDPISFLAGWTSGTPRECQSMRGAGIRMMSDPWSPCICDSAPTRITADRVFILAPGIVRRWIPPCHEQFPAR